MIAVHVKIGYFERAHVGIILKDSIRTWMLQPDQITVPVRINTGVWDFGPKQIDPEKSWTSNWINQCRIRPIYIGSDQITVDSIFVLQNGSNSGPRTGPKNTDRNVTGQTGPNMDRRSNHLYIRKEGFPLRGWF